MLINLTLNCYIYQALIARNGKIVQYIVAKMPFLFRTTRLYFNKLKTIDYITLFEDNNVASII